MSRRFQFSLKTMLVVMLVVAAFFGGVAFQRYLYQPISVVQTLNGNGVLTEVTETIELGDGTKWHRHLELPPE